MNLLCLTEERNFYLSIAFCYIDCSAKIRIHITRDEQGITKRMRF